MKWFDIDEHIAYLKEHLEMASTNLYSAIFANEGHQRISRVVDLKNHTGTLGLFLYGDLLGTAELRWRTPTTVHTDAVRLKREFRRKGHGIWLYLALIRAAKGIGAEKIYSSRYLNSKSRRMWSDKLPEYFDVHHPGCKKPCRHCVQRVQYSINLKGMKLDELHL
jgi:GNAT superfamily N-acetyltransferase